MILLRRAFRRKPVGALPPELLSEDGTEILQPVIAGRGAKRTRGPALFIRIVDDEDVLVGFLVLRLEIGFGCVAAIAPRIDAKHIDGRLALDDPFGKLPAGAAGGGDAEAVAFAQPEVRHIPCRTDDRVAVRGVGDGAVIDLLHTGLAKGGHAVHGGFDMRLQTLKVLLEQLIFGIGTRAVDIACRGTSLVRAEDQATRLLAHVPAAVGIAKDAHFRQPGCLTRLDVVMRLGDDVLMLDRDDRNVQPDHAACLAREVAGGADHMLACDLALVGGDFPLAGGGAGDTCHRGVAVDFGAAVARAARQRLGQVGRLDIAVTRMADGADQPFGVAERPDVLHLVRGEEVHINADGARDTGILPVFVHPVLGLGEADVGDIAEADIHAGFFLKLLIELHGIFMNLADRIGHVEQRQQACGMPCRPRGQLLALDQDNVRPALFREMVKRADADYPASDDNNTCMRFHNGTLQIFRSGHYPRRRLLLGNPAGFAVSDSRAALTPRLLGAGHAAHERMLGKQARKLRLPCDQF